MPTDPILVVSALVEEIGPLTGRVGGGRRGRIAGINAWSGSISGREVVLAAAGEGGRLAARGVEALLDEVKPRALLGIGVAGGLTEGLAAGDLVWSRRVRTEAGMLWEPPSWHWSERATMIPGARGGSVIGMAQIVAQAAAKRDLAKRLAAEAPAVVDLESPAWVAA